MHILNTRRLSLRRMTRDDLGFLSQMLDDPQVMRFYPDKFARESAESWMERTLMRYRQDGHAYWLASEIATGEPRGQVGIIRQEVEGRSLYEVAYMIHRPYWRQGLASEAAAACRDWAFQNLKTDAVHALIRPANVPSQGVARKIGLNPQPEMVQFHGLEHYLFRIDMEEWQRIGPP